MSVLLIRPSRSMLVAVTSFAVLLTALIFLRMRSFEAIMAHENGIGIVDFELAYTSARATEIVGGWGPEAQSAARSSLLLDFAFMPAYAVAFGGITLLIARAHTGVLRPVGLSLAIGCLAAAMLDALENIMLLMILNTGAAQPASPLIAGIAASIKFLLLVLALGYWLVGALAWVIRRARQG